MRAVLPYITGDSEVSLRLIDWFVTNFSKKHNVVLSHELADGSGTSVHFNVYLNYRAQLKAYSKQQFDPFRRRDRIEFFYDEGSPSVETTIGQLNFFRWMLQNRVIDYVTRHAAAIERDMIACQRVEHHQNHQQHHQHQQQHQQQHLQQNQHQQTMAHEKTTLQQQQPPRVSDGGVQQATFVQDGASELQLQQQVAINRRCELSQPCCAIRSMTRVPGAHTVAFE